MNFSEVPPFQHLGNIVAIGVLASFILAVTFLPALVSLLPVRKKPVKEKDDALMIRFSNFVVKNRGKLLWGMAALIIVLVSFIPRNELNDIFLHYFDKKIEFRQDSDYTTENLTGMYIIDYSVESGKSGGISDPAYLSDLARFTAWYRKQPETIHVNSLTDTMKRLNKNMHGDKSEWYKLPARRDLAAQYLLLYEMSLPYGLDLNNQINVDKSSTRLVITTKTLSTNELLTLEDRAQDWLRKNAPNIKSADGSGTTMMFAHIGKRNIVSMLSGTTLALILISGILVIAFRSFKMGLISMVPNLVPAAMGFGLWGLLVGEVGLALSVVSGMTLGIVVDDTVHFMSKYLRARRENNMDTFNAVRQAFKTVGRALLITSIVLIVGFLVLSMSSFKLNSGMGLLTAIIIFLALLADFLFLPSLLMKIEERKK
jgi:predicted RND superfamily exporter protein